MSCTNSSIFKQILLLVFIALPLISFSRITFNTVITDVTCPDDSDGQIEFTGVVGGVDPYLFSIDGGVTFTANPVFTGLKAKNYIVQVMDAIGDFSCQESALVEWTSTLPQMLEYQIQSATPGAGFNAFGETVAIDGDYAVVGNSTITTTDGIQAGAAYIFYRNEGGPNNWGQVKMLTAQNGFQLDRFGVSVGISGNTVVVGNWHFQSSIGPGRAFVFEKDQGGTDNWGLVKELNASDATDGDQFGFAVDISGEFVVVGAKENDNNQGAVYFYQRDLGGAGNWGELIKVQASDGDSFDRFGGAVDINGDFAVIGAFNDEDAASQAGSAYILFKDQGGINNWGEVTKVVAFDAGSADFFGTSVALSGDYVVVGAYNDNGSTGSAYIYEKDLGGQDNWGFLVKKTASDAAGNDWFGWRVALSGDNLLVGAIREDFTGVNNTGSAYLFNRNEGGVNAWGEVAKINASDFAANNNFGIVDINGVDAIVGALGAPNGGQAYFFEFACCPFADAGDIVPPGGLGAQIDLFAGDDIDAFSVSYAAADETEPTPPGDYDYTFLLFNSGGTLIASATTGDFDFSPLPVDYYGVYGISYATALNAPTTLNDYLTNITGDGDLNDLAQILADDQAGDPCLDIEGLTVGNEQVVVGVGAIVPTLGEWGLIILCLLLLNIGTIAVLRRQALLNGTSV
ncbi:MAG: IPTL-CTERM sorting domain-containing protein [Bacteroidota bacterium]